MKKRIFSLLMLTACCTAVFAQTNTTEQSNNYNHWSIDINAGITKPTIPFTAGYYSDTFRNPHGDVGVRYMFNNKFGVKADFGYDQFKDGEDSMPFKSKYYRTSLQGYVNLGRALNFETWTKSLNVLPHLGVGYSWMTSKSFDGRDEMANLIAGLTGELKLASWVALTSDFSVIKNARQNRTFDGNSALTEERGLRGTLFNATVGLAFYLGKHAEHADWYVAKPETPSMDLSQINELESRIKQLETRLQDADRDGVADTFDKEANTPANNIVDGAGRTIVFPKAEKAVKEQPQTKVEDKMTEWNANFKNILFDTGKSTIRPESSSIIEKAAQEMAEYPQYKFYVDGYTDNVGNPGNNKSLSQKRADAVAQALKDNGVESNRIKSRGFGSAKPKCSNKTADGKKCNRRVEIKLQ